MKLSVYDFKFFSDMIRIKKFLLILLLLNLAGINILGYVIGCSSSQNINDGIQGAPRTWKFFTIQLFKDDDIELEKYFGLDEIDYLDSYSITVNLIDKDDYSTVRKRVKVIACVIYPMSKRVLQPYL